MNNYDIKSLSHSEWKYKYHIVFVSGIVDKLYMES